MSLGQQDRGASSSSRIIHCKCQICSELASQKISTSLANSK
jgi:hypothetical protein